MGNYLQSNQPESPHEEDLMVLLATKINLINARNYNQFICATQLDTKEPETYVWAIQGPNTTQLAKTIGEELDQSHKNET